MKKHVCLFEFGVFQGIFPLASGYLEASACADQRLKDAYSFKKYAFVSGQKGVEEAVLVVNADIYAFSCYVWNMGLIQRILPKLLSRNPNAHIILGGPQVMKRGHVYLHPNHENLILCNGEGERTFPSFLRELMNGRPNFSAIRGISYYNKGELITTPNQDRIRDLEEIPSPYLEGYMDPGASIWAVLETNRGCPFKCTYCYWGAATNAKVNKYSQGRIFDEITWFSQNGVYYIFIADANFGMLKRDVEIAKHLVECKKKTGFPGSVYFSSSKNTPERVSEIAAIFAEADLVSAQPISLQTMSDNVLSNVKRENIKAESYIQLQNVLNNRGISSFLEMIWPLPGETLESFKNGIDQLCRSGADSFIVYPLMLIGNVEMEQQIDKYELLSVDDPDINSEAQIVIQTKDVTNAEYLDGIRFSYHVTSLYCLRGLWHVMSYLVEKKGMSYANIVSQFTDFCTTKPNHPYVRFIENTINSSGRYKYSSVGGILHNVLYTNRSEFSELLVDFIRSIGLLEEIEVKMRLDIDILSRPYVYSDTPVVCTDLRLVIPKSVINQVQKVEIPEPYIELAGEILGFENFKNGIIEFDYIKNQLPFMLGKSLEDNYSYCHDRLHKMRSLLPTIDVIVEGVL